MRMFSLGLGGVALVAAVVAAVPATGDIIGTARDDRIRGTSGLDWVEGRGGDDRIWGLGGPDFLHGNAGDDRLYGGPGGDFLNGYSGDDRLYFGPGLDYGLGMGGNDQMHGGRGPEKPIQGGAGRDRIWGGDGNDWLHGNADNDRIWPGAGADKIWGGRGDDRVRLVGNGESDKVDCGSGVDTVQYAGPQDAADSLTNCERVRTYVTTPGCVTRAEWRAATTGMPKAEVHRLFETPGRLSVQRSPTDFGREYRQCEVPRGFDGCWADVDYLVGADGVARLESKAWASLCWSGGGRTAPAGLPFSRSVR